MAAAAVAAFALAFLSRGLTMYFGLILTCSIVQAGLELAVLSQLAEYWDFMHVPLHVAYFLLNHLYILNRMPSI